MSRNEKDKGDLKSRAPIGALLLLALGGLLRAEVPATPDIVRTAGNGATTAFTFGFGVFSSAEVLVRVETNATGALSTLTENSDYTVAFVNDDGWFTPGGTVTTSATYSSAYTLVISRLPPLTQESNWDSAAAFNLEMMEDDLDKSATRDQYLQRQIRRSIRTSDAEIADMNLPSAVERANSFPYFGPAGNLEVVSTVLDLNDVLTSPFWQGVVLEPNLAASLETMGFGAFLRSRALDANDAEFTSALQFGFISVRHFGAVGDGVTDDTAALARALLAGTNGMVVFPPGVYVTRAPLTIPLQVTVLGSQRAAALICSYHNGNAFQLAYETDTVTDIVFKNIAILGDKTAYPTGHGICLTNCAGGTFENVTVGLFGQSGFKTDGGWHIDFSRCYAGNNAGVGFDVNTPHCNLDTCETDAGTHGLFGGPAADNITMDRCHFETATVAGIELYAPTGTVIQFPRITDTHIINSPTGILTNGAGTGQVSNGHIALNHLTGISGTGIDLAAPVGVSMIVAGNSIVSTTIGIHDRSAGYNTIHDNNIGSETAIKLDALNASSVHGNHLGGTKDGILITAGDHEAVGNYHGAATPEPNVTGGSPVLWNYVGGRWRLRGGLIEHTSDSGMLAAKTVVRTFDVNVAGSTDDYQFDDTQANMTEQVITLAGLLPAYAELVSCQVRCFETVTGSAAMSIDVGTSSGGGEILGAADTDAADDINTTAAAAGPELAAGNAARSLYFNATPGVNWDTLTEGRWALLLTYIDYGAAFTQKNP